jgi:hypothetical protein
MSTMTPEEPLVCAHCGRVVEGPELDFRFKLPDSLLAIPQEERGQRVHDGGDMVGAPGVGVFVRVLLPVALTEGYSIRYGTWLQLTSEADFERVRELWHAPEYPSLVLDGILGNAIEPWGRPLMTKVRVGVRAGHEVPYVVTIYDDQMAKVLTETWSQSWVLSAIPPGTWHGHITQTATGQ